MSNAPNKLYEFDTELSLKYFNENKGIIGVSKCYDNVWNLFNIVPNDFDILFFYLEHPQLLGHYFRHCVYVNKENKIIDVTLLIFDSNLSSYNNLEIIEINRFTKSEYLDALSNSMVNGYSSTDLERYLKSNEIIIKKELSKNNKFIIG